MKTLQILPALHVGGVERGVIDLVRAMKKAGDESVVISSGGELVAELQKAGIPHYTLPVHKKSLFSLSLIPRIAEIIERERVDIVHARSRVPAWLAWFAARRAGRPFVTTCHGYYSEHFLSRIMGWGKRVIVISRVVGRHMIDDFGVSPDCIRLIHRGVDLSQFTFKPRPQTAERRPFRILNVGRLSPIKGQVEFLRAIREVKHEIPNLEVFLVGSEGKGKKKYTHEIEQTLRQYNLESTVKLLGTRRDIPELLASADLLVLSTLVPEAFGRVLVEAGAVGTPVVATRVGGVLDVIDDGESGLLVGPGDTQGMAKAIVKVLKNRELGMSFANRLHAKVKDLFSLEQMLTKIMDVYREVHEHQKILVIKLGAVGDVILSVPSLRMLRKRFPNAWISVLVDRKFAPLLTHAPYVNEVIPVDRKKFSNLSYLLKTARKIRRENFDMSIDLQNSKWTHMLAFFSGVRERFGFHRGAMGFLLNRPDRTFDVVQSPVKHQFRILSKLGIRDLDEALELWPSEEKQEEVAALLGSSKEASRVGFVMGSSPNWETKRWPIENFQKLAKRVIEELGCEVVLIGSKEDADWISEKDFAFSDKVKNVMGKTSLDGLVTLMPHLDLLVTGDTAPLHVAAAFQKKIVALFGPTDPSRHMPPVPTADATVFNRFLPCQPCYKGTCQYEEPLACLNHISVNEVFEAVKRQLESAKEQKDSLSNIS